MRVERATVERATAENCEIVFCGLGLKVTNPPIDGETDRQRHFRLKREKRSARFTGSVRRRQIFIP